MRIRFASLLLGPMIAVSGCNGWVVFGHTVGADRPVVPGQPAPNGQTEPTVPRRADHDGETVGAVAPVLAPQARDQVDTDPRFETLGAIAVVVAPRAQQKVDGDPRFEKDGLVAAIEGELRHRNLFDTTDSGRNRSLDVSIDDFATRSASNAVLFGYRLGVGALAADVSVRDAKGAEVRRFRIEANTRLATPANGEATDPLGSLYRRFAILTVDHLTGVRSKSDDSTAEIIPR